MPGQMVAPGGAPPPQQAVLVQGQVFTLFDFDEIQKQISLS